MNWVWRRIVCGARAFLVESWEGEEKVGWLPIYGASLLQTMVGLGEGALGTA